jgi:hypothetical protein
MKQNLIPQTSPGLRNDCLSRSVLALGNTFAGAFQPQALFNGHAPEHGTICLANDSLLRQADQIEELTAFAIGYDSERGSKLTKLRDFICSPRPSNKRIVRLTTYDESEPWQTFNYNRVKRAIGADFAEVPQRVASKADLQLPNRGLSVVLDRDQLDENPNWQELHTKWLLDLLMLGTVLEGVALLQASATTYPTTWDAGSNPDLEVMQDIINVANTTGFYPHNIAYGDQAALKRRSSYESQLTAGALARAGTFTEEQIATAIGVDKCLVNAERYQTATGTTKQEIIGSNVLIFTSLPQSIVDASNLVRHVASGAAGGGDYAVYVTPMGVKKIILTVENYEYLHVQHTTGIEQIQVN